VVGIQVFHAANVRVRQLFAIALLQETHCFSFLSGNSQVTTH
jgi:hypothetical protein